MGIYNEADRRVLKNTLNKIRARREEEDAVRKWRAHGFALEAQAKLLQEEETAALRKGIDNLSAEVEHLKNENKISNIQRKSMTGEADDMREVLRGVVNKCALCWDGKIERMPCTACNPARKVLAKYEKENGNENTT